MKAPDFRLPDQNNQTHAPSDYAGKWLVIYFYPKDDTPGCTTEACSFRDSHSELSQLAEIIGVSKDSVASHRKFADKYKLNFKLLSDPSGETIKVYGAWGKKMFGREGILRKTFIINPDGDIVKTYDRVTPLGHGNQVVVDLKELQTKP